VWPELDKIVSSPSGPYPVELKADNSRPPLYFDINVRILQDNRHKIVGKLVMLRNVSELKTAQFELKGMYETEHELRRDLDQEIKKRSEYSRAIVHELKTPLTSIMACSELLEEQLKDEIEIRLIQNIRRSSSNLLQRVDELFELARGELGLIAINPASLDMNGLIREIVAEMSPLTSQKGLLLRSELPESSLPVIGDKDRLRQVIINLVSNSIKFTDHGEIAIIAGSRSSDFLHIGVSDTGIGMSQEQLANIFDPYRRKSVDGKKNSGLGIGLALCKLIVELHHGTIWAESTPGKGSTVNFTVPYDKQSSPLVNGPSEPAA
jgi:signal transduction histidine kinase